MSLSAPSWARPWRKARLAAPARLGPKIAVIGNCQARGVAQAMRLMAPQSPVTFVPMATLRQDYGDADGLARSLSGYDHVFSQFFPPDLIPGGFVGLRERDPRLRPFPTIVFPAFHPDMVYAGAVSSLAALKLAPSPMGQYHSAIALCAHRLGLSVDQTITLYREDVFLRLGYLDAWDDSVRDLLASAAQVGFSLDQELARWPRRGSFMHVLNHPKAFVIGDIARRLLKESGFDPEPVEVEDYLGDELARDVVWPVYPPIAETYGLTGSYLFKMKPAEGTFPRLYDLRGFLAQSFSIYDGLTSEALACTRVDVWLGTPEIAEIFETAKARA
ncbi:WcbI family polysaccharide biosynthesis putative acetyltransferase [Methylobacterium iners]|uniref:WcbI family polysaccharide biosynthesis putative acetyltransferase n=1 Tax=Methylobacterium iners TaxID=418707 RepID=UPI00366C23FB